MPEPIVLDTNFVVSAILLPRSIAARALAMAFEHFEPVYATETIADWLMC